MGAEALPIVDIIIQGHNIFRPQPKLRQRVLNYLAGPWHYKNIILISNTDQAVKMLLQTFYRVCRKETVRDLVRINIPYIITTYKYVLFILHVYLPGWYNGGSRVGDNDEFSQAKFVVIILGRRCRAGR